MSAAGTIIIVAYLHVNRRCSPVLFRAGINNFEAGHIFVSDNSISERSRAGGALYRASRPTQRDGGRGEE